MRAETFADVAARHIEHAQRVNKSWRQSDALVRKHLLPRWGRLRARDVTRGDVRAVVRNVTAGGAPVVANEVLKAASAIFAWAIREEIGEITVNPCYGVTANPTKPRERVLADGELPRFWAAFDGAGLARGAALKAILLTGQRPGEIAHLRREHLRDGWWELPGEPDPRLGWPGTKNGQSHRVWLTQPVRDLLAELKRLQWIRILRRRPRHAARIRLGRSAAGVVQRLGRGRARQGHAARPAPDARHPDHRPGFRPRRDEPHPEPP